MTILTIIFASYVAALITAIALGLAAREGGDDD